MLNFDEFRAVSNRDKTRKKAGASKSISSTDEPSVNGAKATLDVAPFYVRILFTIGEFLETHQMQSMYIMLIFMDTFGALIISYAHEPERIIPQISNQSIYSAINSFMIFTLLFFITEIIAVILIFGSRVLGHFGYLLDCAIIGYQAWSLYHRGQNEDISRILNIFRFWRLFRLFLSMVQLEKDKHAEELKRLHESVEQLATRESEIHSLQSDIKKEREARAAIEAMLGSYKDEVDTLNEALRIAAMDIAEVAQDDEDASLDAGDDLSMNSQDDADDISTAIDGGGSSKASLSSAGRHSASKSAIMRAVMSNAGDRSREAATEVRQAATAFLVHEDGTFEQK